MQTGSQKQSFKTLLKNEDHIWSAGWSAQISQGFIGIIWAASDEDKTKGIQKIDYADNQISELIARTSAVQQSSRQHKTDEELARIGKETAALWDDYYTNAARLLRSLCPAKLSMMWGKAGSEVLKARSAQSNFSSIGTTDKVLWDRLRASRRDRRALRDSFFGTSNTLQESAELLYQSYFYHHKSIYDALRRYSVEQDQNWYLATQWKYRLDSDAEEAGEKAIRAIFKLIDNFDEALRPATFKLLEQHDPRVIPGPWTCLPKSIHL
jgi:hypothetical protein